MSPVFRHGGLRLYLLKLLDEAPRHGYEVIRLLQDRFLGVYAPSPGTIYPRLARLEEEGLVTHDEVDGKKVYRITDKGREEINSRLDDLAELEEELTQSVRDIAREVTEDVRDTVRNLREELTWAAKDVRRGRRAASRRRRARTPGSGPGGPGTRSGRAPGGPGTRRGRRPGRRRGGPAGRGPAGPTTRCASRPGGPGRRGRSAKPRQRQEGHGPAAAAPQGVGRLGLVAVAGLDRVARSGPASGRRAAAAGPAPRPGRRPVPRPGAAGHRLRPGAAQGRLEHRVRRRERARRPAVDPGGRAGQDQGRGLRRRRRPGAPTRKTTSPERDDSVRLVSAAGQAWLQRRARPCRTVPRRSWRPGRRGPASSGSVRSISGRTPVCSQNRSSRPSSSRVPIVDPTTDSCRKNTRLRSAGGTEPLVAPEITIRPAGLERAQRVRPGGLADRLHHRVHPLRQPGAGRERLVRAERDGPRPAWPRCGWWPRPGSRPPGRAGSARWRRRRPRPGPAPWRRAAMPARLNSIR